MPKTMAGLTLDEQAAGWLRAARAAPRRAPQHPGKDDRRAATAPSEADHPVDLRDHRVIVIDGPFAETKELMRGPIER